MRKIATIQPNKYKKFCKNAKIVIDMMSRVCYIRLVAIPQRKGGKKMNTAKLKGKMRELNVTQEDLAKLIGISLSTLNRKLQEENGEGFTIGEAMRIRNSLKLSAEEASQIFLP